MKMKRPTPLEERALSLIGPSRDTSPLPFHKYSEWIRTIRVGLRMTQAELAKRANVTQPHLAGIESGKIDPQVATLCRIFDALECDCCIYPRFRKEFPVLLKDRARTIVRKRLERVLGNMAMEGYKAEPKVIEHVLEKRVQAFLHDPQERVWDCQND